jgi:Pentapeptide repeats (8 copies)
VTDGLALRELLKRLRQSRWPPTRTQLLWAGGIAALAFLIIVICGYLFGWKWTGLPKQTLWDWLQLLIIPAVLAGVGLWFNRQQREQGLQTADRRAQDEALQAYFDQIGQLLLDKDPSLREAKEDDEVRTLARARTLSVLARLDGERKASIVRFLSEATLIQKEEGANDEHVLSLPVISLFGADLSGANLSGANLRGAELSYADLSYADLRGVFLFQADLRGAVLIGADLSEARVWTEEQLREASSLEGAIMPDDQILKSKDNPDGPTFEEWLKSREEGDSATPEQRGPWWGGPYHRRGIWRRLFGG